MWHVCPLRSLNVCHCGSCWHLALSKLSRSSLYLFTLVGLVVLGTKGALAEVAVLDSLESVECSEFVEIEHASHVWSGLGLFDAPRNAFVMEQSGKFCTLGRKVIGPPDLLLEFGVFDHFWYPVWVFGGP